MSPDHCPICASTDLLVFLEVDRVPVHCNLLWSTPAEALAAPRGGITLALCQSCGHLFNLAFNPQWMEYDQTYENSLHFSPGFQRYATWLAGDLVTRYSLHDKTVMEIGCGKGEFLSLLCALGDNQGIGFDPAFEPSQVDERLAAKITFIPDFYSERSPAYPTDFVCSRHVLEHLPDPGGFVRLIRARLGENPGLVFFIEVPNGSYMLRAGAIWDLIYEHYSYFSRSSLETLLVGAGYRVLRSYDTYAGQFLCVDAALGEGDESRRSLYRKSRLKLAESARLFSQQFRAKLDHWNARMRRYALEGRPVAVWGAGSKGITFLNLLDEPEAVAFIVDINPAKQGMYAAGRGHKILAPAALTHLGGGVVVIMNPIYLGEIQTMCESLRLNVAFECA